ncbi:hypothetical protein BH11PLA2_BH11PLA2_36520 [soil metagenome]
MPRRNVALTASHLYHVYNRGHDRETIFHDEDDYARFLKSIRKYLLSDCRVIAYTLMPNHYHLVLEVLTDKLSAAMMKLGVSYGKAMNLKRHRVGACFQGPFQAIEVHADEYLLQLTQYVHWNPVRAGLVAKPDDWPFSNYRDYVGLRNGTLPVMERIYELMWSVDTVKDQAWWTESRRRYQAVPPPQRMIDD